MGPRRLWPVAVLISQSSLLFGYGMAALASVCIKTSDSHSTGSILHDVDLSEGEQELATGLLLAGAWAGSLLSGPPCERLGRRKVLLMNNFLFLAGSLLCCIVSRDLLYVGRLVLGVAVGVESVVVPMLLSEIAPADERGAVTSLHQVAVTSGILLAGVLSYVFVGGVHQGWRYVQAFEMIPAALQLLGAPLLPESPRWLVRQGRGVAEVREVLRPLRSDQTDDALDAEVRGMEAEVAAEANADQASWGEVFSEHSACLWLGVGLMVAQSLTGINTVILYSTDIFADAGVSEAILATVSVGAVNVLMTLVSLKLVDVWGRKSLLLLGTSIMLGALLGLSVTLLALSGHASLQGALSVLFVLVYVAGFAVGLGAVCWVVLSETVPSRVRAKTQSLFLAVNWAINLVISLGTLSLIDALGGVESSMDDDTKSDHTMTGEGIMYGIYAFVCVAALAFIIGRVQETKGRTLEELQGQGQRKPAAQLSTSESGREPLLANEGGV